MRPETCLTHRPLLKILMRRKNIEHFQSEAGAIEAIHPLPFLDL
jgi:hypothetical protein